MTKQSKHTARPKASEMVKFNFHGDELDVVPKDGDAFVVVKRVCGALGIRFSGQIAKLQNDPSAVVQMIWTTAPDGKNYEMFCISLDSLPLWLATIHPSKVKPAVRAKLIRYKRECQRVLADHFFGRRGASHPTELPPELLAALELLPIMLKQNADFKEQIEDLARKIAEAQPGTLTVFQAHWIRAQISELAEMMVDLGKARTLRSAKTTIQNLLVSAAQWGGRGHFRCNMPSARFPYVKTCLDTLRSGLESERKAKQRAERGGEPVSTASNARQLRLFKANVN